MSNEELDEGLCNGNGCDKMYDFVVGEDTGFCSECDDATYDESLVASASPDPDDHLVFDRATRRLARLRARTVERRAEKLREAQQRTHDAIEVSAALREKERAEIRARKPQLTIV